MQKGGVFIFAGIWDRWEGEGETLDSCSIIVMPSNEVMKPIHERMPAIIAPVGILAQSDHSFWNIPII